jgi:hypothetical protein
MLNFIIKTHRVGTIYTKPHLFILNKGMNSGKPQKEPFTNSFVVLFQNEDECESLFFIAYSLWKTKFWHQFLCGSVIPFLRLPDFKKEFFPKEKSHDGRARATCKAYCSTKTSGTKRKAISREYQSHKRYAESNFIPLLQ